VEQKAIYPKLRNIDAFPAEVEGQQVVCLRDPLNLAGKILFVPFPAFFIVRLLDGQHSILDIQTEFMRQFGRLLYREDVDRLIGKLDENLLLESDRFRVYEREMIKTYRGSPSRAMALSGESYDTKPEKLEKAINAFYQAPDGPGVPGLLHEPAWLLGVVAPHIDYRRGGYCYAHAHRAILETCAAEVFVLLGTAHMAMTNPYALTAKDFETPFGLVRSDQEFLEEMRRHSKTDFYADELIHKGEHSIELQVVFQRASWKNRPPFQIVPVLCGSFHEALLKDKSPMEIPGVEEFIDALKKAAHRSARPVCFLASADLAHMGLRFGDPEPPNPSSLRSLEAEDRKLLEYIERVDADGFYEELRREKDRRKICGLSSIYTLLKVTEAKEGTLLKYGQSFDAPTQSVVTFASLALYG